MSLTFNMRNPSNVLDKSAPLPKALFLLLLMHFVSMSSAQESCLLNDHYNSWGEAREICEKYLLQLDDEKTPQLVAETYLRYVNIAYDFKQYKVAEELLVIIKNKYLTHLRNDKPHFNFYYLSGRVQLRRENFEQAEVNLKAALAILDNTELTEKNKLLSYALNVLGITYKRMNKYQMALIAYRESLSYKRQFGSSVTVAKTLTNVATVYGLLEDHDNALTYYLEAQDHFLAENINLAVDYISLSHNYENIGTVYNKLARYQESIDALNEALHVFPENRKNFNLVNIFTHMANSYLHMDQLNKAEEYYLKALDEDQKNHVNNPQLRLELGHYYFNKNQPEQALGFVSEGLNIVKDNEINKQTMSELYLLKSQIQQQLNQLDSAMSNLVIHNQLREEVLANKFNQDIKNVTYQIEIEKNQFDLALLAKENQLSEVKINRQYWVIFSFILLAVMATFYLRNVLKKKSSEKQKLLAAINLHKDQLSKLENSKDQLNGIFKETTDAILCIDSGGVIAFHNAKFNKLFNDKADDIKGKKMQEILPGLFDSISSLPLDNNDMPENSVIKGFAIKTASGMSKIDIRINTINLLDDFTVLSVGDKNHQLIKDLNSKDQAISHIIDNLSENDSLNSTTLEILKSELQKNIYTKVLKEKSDTDFRMNLVELMQDCVEIWSAHTKTNRIELADVSGYWKVTIDDGRLRTRAMDRYLQVKNLPKNPRWRQVVKTAHYILAECDLNTIHRQKLNQTLEAFLSIIKER